MIIQENVLVTLNSITSKHYKSLGYSIPTHIDKNHRVSIKMGTKILVKIQDLPTQSNIKVPVVCDSCSKENLVEYSKVKKSGDYLCVGCSHNTKSFRDAISKANKGRKFTPEQIIKLTNSGFWIGQFGKNNPMWNPNLTDEERKKRHNISGINKWKKLVKERDKYICQRCSSNKHLFVHHLNNFRDFKEQRLDVDNGITLCFDCHYLFHKTFGFKHTTKEMFENFMKFSNLQTYQDEFSYPKILEDFGSSVT